MARTLSLITAVTATALLVALPAAWAQTPPDAVERALGAHLGTIQQDAFERAAATGAASLRPTTMTDAFERAVADRTQSATPSTDAFLRALGNRTGLVSGSPYGDQHERGDGSALTAPAPLASSGSAVEWPQVGIGFGLGIALALGLGLVMRLARPRQLAH